jgi:hypothetical protein
MSEACPKCGSPKDGVLFEATIDGKQLGPNIEQYACWSTYDTASKEFDQTVMCKVIAKQVSDFKNRPEFKQLEQTIEALIDKWLVCKEIRAVTAGMEVILDERLPKVYGAYQVMLEELRKGDR